MPTIDSLNNNINEDYKSINVKDTINTQPNSIIEAANNKSTGTETNSIVEDFKNDVKEIFNKYKIQFSDNILIKILDKKLDAEVLVNNKNFYINYIKFVVKKYSSNGQININNASRMLNIYKYAINLGYTENEIAQFQDEYLKNGDAKEYLNKIQKLKDSNASPNEIKKEYMLMLLILSDDDKTNLISDIIDIMPDIESINSLFNSIDDNQKASEAADCVTLEQLQTLDNISQNAILIQMTPKKIDEHLDQFNEEFQKFYKLNHDNIAQILECINKKKDIPDILQPIANEFFEKLNFRASLEIGNYQNKNSTEAEKEKCNRKIEEIFEQYPEVYNEYLNVFGSFLEKHATELNIDIDQFKQFMQETIGDDRYNKVFENIPQKSAIDENGNFKTQQVEEILCSRNTIEDIKRIIQEQSHNITRDNPKSYTPNEKSQITDEKTILPEFGLNLNLKTISLGIKEKIYTFENLANDFSKLPSILKNFVIVNYLNNKKGSELADSIDNIDTHSEKVNLAIECHLDEKYYDKLGLDSYARKNLT